MTLYKNRQVHNLTTNIIRDFNRAAAHYDMHASLQRQVARELFSRCKSELEKAGKILDIGCGTGYFHELLRSNGIYRPLTQVDIAYNMCKTAHLYASPPEYGGCYTVNADMTALPFARGAFDVVFSSMTMQWSQNLAHDLSQAAHVLGKGGKLFISTICEGSLFQLRESFAMLDEIPHIHAFKNREEVIKAFGKAGFGTVKTGHATITKQFDNIYSLLASIKSVGAGFKGKRAGYPGKGYFRTLETVYKKHYGDKMPLTWEILYVEAQ